MRKLLLALSGFAFLCGAAPVISSAAVAQERTVIIKRDGDRGWHRGHRSTRTVIVKRDRGYHRGWDRGRHRGWDHNRRGRTVIIDRR